jgi:hypothetical protein
VQANSRQLTFFQALLQVSFPAFVVETVDESHLFNLSDLIICLGTDSFDVSSTPQFTLLVFVFNCFGGGCSSPTHLDLWVTGSLAYLQWRQQCDHDMCQTSTAPIWN